MCNANFNQYKKSSEKDMQGIHKPLYLTPCVKISFGLQINKPLLSLFFFLVFVLSTVVELTNTKSPFSENSYISFLIGSRLITNSFTLLNAFTITS
jgi:hypothetical protein